MDEANGLLPDDKLTIFCEVSGKLISYCCDINFLVSIVVEVLRFLHF